MLSLWCLRSLMFWESFLSYFRPVLKSPNCELGNKIICIYMFCQCWLIKMSKGFNSKKVADTNNIITNIWNWLARRTIAKTGIFSAVCLRLAFFCCKGTALYCIIIYHFITGKRRHFLIIYFDITICHSIIGGRRHSYNDIIILIYMYHDLSLYHQEKKTLLLY